MGTKAGKDFIFASQHEVMDPSPESQGLPQPPLETPCEIAEAIYDLPKYPDMEHPVADLWETMQIRKTLRKYQPTPLTIDEVSLMLWFTQGVKSVTDRPVTMRTVPSGGARHPLETYLVVSNVSGLEPGLYRFMAIENKLALIRPGNKLNEEISAACQNQHQVRDCPVSFWWAAITERGVWRYSTRAYRYLMLDAGHVCQNLCLAAEGIGCGVCEIGAFTDRHINQFFNLDGEDHFMIYGATVGKR